MTSAFHACGARWPQDRRAAGGEDAAEAADQSGARLRDLPVTGPTPQLPYRLREVQHAVQVGVRQMPAVRVDGEAASRAQVAVFDKGAALPFPAKPEVFELYQDAVGRVVVQQGQVDFPGRHPGGPEHLLAGLARRRRRCDHVGAVGKVLAAVRLGKAQDGHRLGRVAERPFQGRHDRGGSSVADVGQIVLAQRGDDERRFFVGLQAEGLAELGLGIAHRILSLRHRDHAQLPGRGAEFVHVPPSSQGVRSHTPGESVALFKIFVPHPDPAVPLRRPAGAAVFPVGAQHDAADAGADQQRRLFEHGNRRRAPEVDVGGKARPDAQVPGHVLAVHVGDVHVQVACQHPVHR